MYLKRQEKYDVLVAGAGIAGISAALAAAEAGCSVLLVSSAEIFSGSSFYPGTWGLGLIGPANEEDQDELADTIASVGCGMTDRELVKTFVAGIHPAIENLKTMGVRLRRAGRAEEREFIPCFDHKHRDWNGIEFDSARKVLSARMDELGVICRSHWEVLELAQQGGRVCGVVVHAGGHIRYVGCRALVLASGGYGGIFKYHLNTEDVAGTGQFLALKAGCTLVNMEFMQMMPGCLSPAPKTIFNEKTFRYARMLRTDGTPLLSGIPDAEALLEFRSGHGPFTSRLPSKEVDLAIFREFVRDERGISVTYSDDMLREPPEFIRTYFDWLAKAKGLTMDDPIRLGIFAHAANGGVRIAQDTSTGVPGLFACGEVTGGMHGADRLGGLSTANGLVFGGKAGRSAALDSRTAPESADVWEFKPWRVREADQLLAELREIMFCNAMILRTEPGLTAALDRVRDMAATLERAGTEDAAQAAAGRRLEARLYTAQAVLLAALLRRESRGAHYRQDYPDMDEGQSRKILLKMDKGGINAQYEE